MNTSAVSKCVCRIGIASAACVFALVAAGCAHAPYEGLPDSHLDAQGEIEFNHNRCGACHIDAQRGNPSFVSSEDMSVVDAFGVVIPEQEYDLPDAGQLPPSFNLE